MKIPDLKNLGVSAETLENLPRDPMGFTSALMPELVLRLLAVTATQAGIAPAAQAEFWESRPSLKLQIETQAPVLATALWLQIEFTRRMEWEKALSEWRAGVQAALAMLDVRIPKPD